MVGKNNKQIKNTKEGTKVESYSIKKFKVGAASVVIGASIFFGAGVAAAADTQENSADNNTTTEKSDATVTSDEAPKAVAQPKAETTAKEATTSEVAAAVENKTAKEEVKVDATALNTLISDIKGNKAAGEYDNKTDESVKALDEAVKNAEVTAKTATTQEAIDKAVATLTEKIAGLKEKEVKAEEKAETPKADAKEEAKAEEKTEAKEETTTDAKAEVVEAKKELDHLVAEGQAWVPAVAKEATKVEDATAKANLESAVAKVSTKVAEALNVINNNEATKDDVKTKSSELRSALEAVQVARVRAGYTEASAAAVLDNTEYSVGNPSVIDAGDRIGNSGTINDSSHAMSNNTLVIDGVTVANPTGQASSASGASTLAEAVKLTYTAEPTHPAMMPANSLILYGQNYGNDANGANGRDDYPVSKEQFDKLNAERELWNGQPSASGWSTSTTTTGTGSTYEYLATEIYGYAYEQGEEVAITNFSKRFGLSEEATNAGWKILGVLPTNLPNGLTYDSATDTISGKISSNLENGVYDDRVNVYVTNGSTTVRYFLANYAVGWIGWKDTTAPTTVTTDDITNAGSTLNTNIHFNDNAAPATNTADGTSRKTVTTRADGSITVEAPAWRSVAETSVLGADQINGISYSTTTGNLTGTASTAGIYTVTAQVKDYADTPGNEWTQSGQESHESFTVTVRPGVTIGNVVAGATEVPITVSDGATQITVTLPDGTTVEAAKGTDGNWLITGGTSSTATKGTNIGSGTAIKTPVNASSTTVGVDNISAVVAAENVSATLLTQNITLTTAQGETVVASFNKEAGRWIINSVNGATVTTVDDAEKANDIAEQWVLVQNGNKGRISYRVENTDDTYSVRNLEIVSDLAATNNRGGSTGANSYRVFEYTQTYDANGNVTAASSARSDAQTVNTAVVVTYDAATNTWTASDGSTVTATPNVTRYSTTDAASDAWGHGEDGKDYTAIRSASEMKTEKDGAGQTVPVYRDTESWTITTSSGVSGVVNRVSNKARDYASVTNTLPTAKGTDYSTDLNSTVNLLDPTKVTTADEEDTTPIVTKVTVTAPDGTVTTFEPTAELAVLNNAKAAVSTAQDAYTQATSDLKTAVDARIEADAAATAKNTELATAETTLDAAISEYKIAKAMVDNGNLSGDALTAAQTRLTNAETAQTAASTKVNTLTTELTTLHNKVATAQAAVNEKLATANTTRAALEEKEDELTSAKNSVKAAVTNALNGSDAFKLDQVGKYKVSLSVIDNASNQVLSDATATGTTEGEDTNSGTVTISDVTADYTITVNPFDLVGTPKTSTDIQGATQTGQPTFTFDDTDKSEINQGTKVYTLASTEAKDADGKTAGTYSIDATTGVVTFVPNKDYTGTPTPAEVTLTVTFGTGDDAVTKSATATYTPTVVPVKPVAKPSETTDIQGATQTSTIVYNADNNDDSNNTTLNFAKGSAVVNGETKSVELDKKTVQFVNAEGTAVDTLTVENQGTYTLVKDSEGNVTGVQFVPVASFTGDATPVKVQIKDANGTAVQTTYTPHVTPVTATGTPATSTDIQGVEQSGTPTFTVSDETNIVKGDDNKPKATYALKGADADGKVEVKDGDKVLYTYTINPTTGEVTFTPAKDYTGTPTPATVVATYTLATADETDTTTTPITAEATYTPTIVPVTPAARPSETTGVQGAAQTSKISYDADGNNDGDNTTLNFAKGSKAVNNETKSVPLDPKTVQFVNANGDAVDTLTVAGQGTYTLEKDGEGNVTGVKFQPVATFTGDATPVNVQIKDENGTVATTTYTPHVTPVTATAEPATSTATQGSTQSGTPTYNAPKVEGATITPKYELEGADAEGKVVVPNVGTYTIDKDGKVTFVPVASYTGTPEGVKVNVTYSITTGTEGETPAEVKASTTYTPTVTPVTAEGTPKESTDIQGAVQHGTPEFKVSDETNIVKGEDGKPKATYALKGADAEGKVEVKDGDKVLYTYTIDKATGEVTFTPAKDYTGTPTPATVVATYTLETADKDDTTTTPITAEATYTPTIVPVTPTANESSTTGIQGAVQKSPIVLDNKDSNVNTLNFNKGTENVNGTDKSVNLDPKSVTLLDAQGNPATSVTVAGQGTYTIVTEEDGSKSVQFTPVASYTGDVTPVTVQIADANGTKVTTTYTPKIVGVTPVADASQTTGKQGQAQTSTIVYDADNNSDGNITTLNLAGGSATVNGTKQTAALDKKSVTLLDAQGNATDSVTVAGQGTYTLVKDAEGNVTGVTFTPEASFTGTATPVNVRVTDVNGNTAKTTYTPTVIPNGTVVVNYVDEEGKVIKTPVTNKDLEDGSNYDTTPNRDGKITGTDGTVYYYKKLDDNSAAAKGKVNGGDTTEVTYVYEKAGSVTVNYVDKDGNVIKKPVTDEDNVKAGTKYDTTDNKPTTIVTEEGKTYKLVPNETKGNETGTVVSGENTQVTYTYEEVKGNVVVENYDSKGNKLGDATTVVKDSSTGKDYSTTPKEKIEVNGKTYFYKEVKSDSAPESGKVKEGTTTVKYVYEEAGSVVVNYTLADGTVIKPQNNTAFKDVKAGTDYSTDNDTLKPTTITTAEGKTYRLVPTATKGNENGKVVSGETTEVTYIYEEVKGNVVVENYDTKGNKLSSEDVVKDSSTGTDYSTKPEEKITANGKTYFYKEVKSDSAKESGKVTEGTTTVKYVYEEAGSVVVNYTDKDGNVIKPQNNTTFKDVKAGTDYNTNNGTLKPTTIKTADGKTYRLVEVKGNETGKVVSGETTQVTYVYELVPVTSFVDENGNPISNTEDGTKPKKDIPGYEYVRTTTDKDGNTVHIYKKVTNPTTDKVTKYVDENGNPISNTEDGTKPKKDIPGYEYVRTYTDKDGNTVHVYKKVVTPVTPTTPENVKPTSVVKEKQLPNTEATSTNSANAAATGAGLIALIAAAVRRRKNNK